MERSNCARVLLGVLVLGSLVSLGCKKDEDPATVPVPSSTAAATTPPPATSATDQPATSTSAAQTAAPQPVVTTTAPKQAESIDACCSALNAVAKSGKSGVAKSKAAAAAAVCPGIAKLVKAGTTTRASGLSQIRSALTGYDVPGECR